MAWIDQKIGPSVVLFDKVLEALLRVALEPQLPKGKKVAENAPVSPEASVREINVSYIKSKSFRVIYADGSWGGVTPRGLLNFGFYNERRPIPRETRVQLQGDVVAQEIQLEGRSGVVREVEVNVVMNLENAKEFHVWLGNHIANLEKMLSEHATDASKS